MESNRFVMNDVSRTLRRVQLVPLAALALFFGFPVASMLVRFLRPNTVMDTIADSSLAQVWWFTTWQATASTILTVVVGLPLTWALARYSFPGARTIMGLVTVPFFMPAVVIATGVKAILSAPSVTGILWAHVVFNVAVIVRIVGPRWALMDPSLEDTAADLGANAWRTFRFISLPYISDALRQASAIVFMFCFSSFGVIAILGGISRRTVEAEVFIQAVRLGDTKTAISLSVLQVIAILLVYTVGVRHQYSQQEELSVSSQQRTIAPRLRIPLTMAVVIPTVIVATPLLGVIARSLIVDGSLTLNSYRWLFNGTTEAVGINAASTLVTSLSFALACAVVTTLCALIIANARNNSGLINVLTAAPLMTSAVTLGLGVIVTFNANPFNWRSERWLIPVLHCVIALPLVLRTLDPAVRAIPIETRQAAASLGASPWRVWRRIELPLLQPAIRRAAGLSAAISLGEFGATSFLTRSDSTTIPLAIQQLLGHPGDTLTQSAFALAALCVVAFTLALRAT